MTRYEELLHIISCGPDYIVATVQREEGRWTAVQNNWLDLLHMARHDSGLVEDASIMGYAGLLAGKVFWGSRWDGSLLRITGADAGTYWHYWLQATGKPTRLDLQVTLRLGAKWNDFIRLAKEGVDEANKKLGAARQRKVQLHTDNAHGHTLYVGSRKSASYGRIYHKYPTDKDRYEYGDVRLEVELHADQAALAMESYMQSERAIGEYAVGFVFDWFGRRGFELTQANAPEVNSRFTDVLEASPLDSKLQWLYNQVGPTMRLLADQGHMAATFRVLYGPQWPDYVLGRLMAEEGNDDGADD